MPRLKVGEFFTVTILGEKQDFKVLSLDIADDQSECPPAVASESELEIVPYMAKEEQKTDDLTTLLSKLKITCKAKDGIEFVGFTEQLERVKEILNLKHKSI